MGLGSGKTYSGSRGQKGTGFGSATLFFGTFLDLVAFQLLRI